MAAITEKYGNSRQKIGQEVIKTNLIIKNIENIDIHWETGNQQRKREKEREGETERII